MKNFDVPVSTKFESFLKFGGAVSQVQLWSDFVLGQ